MIVKAADLIALFRQALDEKWGYIWGRWHCLWTAANQAAINKTTDEVYAKAREYGEKWVGHIVTDCSGLGYWAFRQCGGAIYHGSNTIWARYVTGRCDLKNGKRTDGGAILPGYLVFLRKKKNGVWNRHHIGYYVGDGTVIEAKGTYYGVVTSKLSHWHETAHWLNVEYEGGVIFVGKPILRLGSTGEDVRKLQELLNEAGYYLEADGKFGAKTESAVKDFQYDHGLKDDGIVGDMTWDALEKATGGDQNDQQPPENGYEDGYTEPVDSVLHPPDVVQMARADYNEIMRILCKYEQ